MGEAVHLGDPNVDSEPATTTQRGSLGNRPSAVTNERMRPPVSPASTTRSPGTGDPLRLPLVERLLAA